MICEVTGKECPRFKEFKTALLQKIYIWLAEGGTPPPGTARDPEFEKLWDSWPEGDRFRRPDCARMFATIRKAGKLPEFRKACQDYSDYIKAQELERNFKQRPQHLATFMRNWEGDAETYARVAGRPNW